MGVSNVTAEAYSSYSATSTKATSKKEDTATAKKTEDAVVYEKSNESGKKATYSINKMSAKDRAAVVAQMKQESFDRQSRLSSLVSEMLSKQAGASNLASMFTPDKLKNVSAEDIAQAKADVAEDGYWGVEQTSERMVSMAKALSGGDPAYADKMIAAIKKGFDQATEAWGEDLPDICKNTIDTAVKKMEEWRDSMTTAATE